MCDCMFGQEDLFSEFAQFLSDAVEVDYAVVDGLLVGVVLRDPESF